MERFIIAINGAWLTCQPKFARRVGEQHLLPIGSNVNGLKYGCKVLVKFRGGSGEILVDNESRIEGIKDELFLKSSPLCGYLTGAHLPGSIMVLCFEGIPSEARCVVSILTPDFFADLEQEDPSLRLSVFQLPPLNTTLVEAQHLVDLLYTRLGAIDPELLGVHAGSFLDAPHILVLLFEHVLGLSSQEQVEFPIQLKKLAEQLRILLTHQDCRTVRIERIERDHQSIWAEVLGDSIAFLDGGVARIAGIPGSEPLAMRVGIYKVRPGVEENNKREEWTLIPYVIGDILDSLPVPAAGMSPSGERRKRLQEAGRFVLEALTALTYLRRDPEIRILFLHGPLINQFTEYDEGEPNYVPCISPVFLERFGITRQEVEGVIQGIPKGSRNEVLWNHFMAVYGYLTAVLFQTPRPVVGVVERARGSWLAKEVLRGLVKDDLVKDSYAAKVRGILEKYQISDDFLFGCVLEEGEFITPLQISKNDIRRARDHWKRVVQQYPKPFASVIKTSRTNFPFRVELNESAANMSDWFVFRLLYHTARLLPQYAFPVGLDIVDKYAKVPDWISRGVSARLSAEILRRALRTGDPALVHQVRVFLARAPRDFFFRPEV